MKKRTQQLFAFGFGVTFVVTMLILAIAFPNPTPFQYTVFRVTLALATAGVTAMIPGFIEIELPNWLRAGGALAVFVVVYFYNPASLVVPPAEKPSAQAEKPAWIVRRKYIWSQPGLARAVYCAGTHQQTEKITTLLFLQLVNQDERPRQVVGYRVEVFEAGHWHPFGRARALRSDASTYVEFATPGSPSPRYFELSGREFDRALVVRPIGPGSSVEGWALLNYYLGPVPEINAAVDLRIAIEDAFGQASVFSILPPAEDDLGYFQVPEMKLAGWQPPCIGS